jgi:RhtB (resistance to homoserine/threonine) family protein
MENFLTITTVFLLGAISPGPDLIVVLRQSLAKGRAAGVITALGIASGCLVHVLYSILGLGLIISQSVMAFNVLKTLGGAYLLYLSYHMLKSNGLDIGKEEHKKSTSRYNNPWTVGFMTNAFNPKATIFMLSIFSVAISADTPFVVRGLYGLWGAFIVLLWFSLVAFVISNPKITNWFSRASKWIDRTFGAVLALLGIKLLFSRLK